MEKVLNQEEIDAMVRAAQGRATASTGPDVRVWDLLKAGQVREDQMRALALVHENFARTLSNALSAYFRVTCEATLVSAEYLPYEDFLQRFPEGSYLGSCSLKPLAATAIIEMDASLMFPMIDLLLGGPGKAPVANREMTEIEEQILASTMRIICNQLQAAWQVLGVEFCFEQRQPASQAQRLMNVKERTFSLSFEIHMNDTRGTLNIAIPALASHALLRKLSATWAQKTGHVSADHLQSLRTRLLMCPFSVELSVQHLRVPLRELAALSPAQLVVFRRSAESLGSVLVGGMQLFSAAPAQRNSLRVALIAGPTEDK
jgi:flagellar motor switch protein FliM